MKYTNGIGIDWGEDKDGLSYYVYIRQVDKRYNKGYILGYLRGGDRDEPEVMVSYGVYGCIDGKSVLNRFDQLEDAIKYARRYWSIGDDLIERYRQMDTQYPSKQEKRSKDIPKDERR